MKRSEDKIVIMRPDNETKKKVSSSNNQAVEGDIEDEVEHSLYFRDHEISR